VDILLTAEWWKVISTQASQQAVLCLSAVSLLLPRSVVRQSMAARRLQPVWLQNVRDLISSLPAAMTIN